MYRILFTGSRTWTDFELVERHILELASEQTDPICIHGHCPSGLDRFVDMICAQYNIPVERHPAEWNKYGRSAGQKRNAEMVKLGADECVAYIKDASPGATKCSEMAEKAGIPTFRHRRL